MRKNQFMNFVINLYITLKFCCLSNTQNINFEDLIPGAHIITKLDHNCSTKAYPFMLQVGYIRSYRHGDTINFKPLCGGILIKPIYVLTVANCLKRITGAMLVLGRNRNNSLVSAHVERISMYHEDSNKLNAYDIAMIKLKSPLFKSDPALPTLPNNKQSYPPCENALVVAWKEVVTKWKANDNKEKCKNSHYELQCGLVPLILYKYCKNMYQFLKLAKSATLPGIFCSNSTDMPKNNANLTLSGGAVFCNEILVGLTSFAFPSDYYDLPDIYTNINYYNNYMKTTMQKFARERWRSR